MILSMNADENNAPVPDNGKGVQRPDDDGTNEGPTGESRRRRETRPGRTLLRGARLLPIATVAVWIATIFVPVLDSGNTYGPRITITSLGDAPLYTGELNPGLVAIWILIVVIALLPWLFGHSQWWSAAVIVIGIVILLSLVVAVIDPPLLMWDGQTAEGMPTGGMEVARPDIGFVLWIIGSLALVAAGVCGWVGGRRMKKHSDQACRPVREGRGSQL